MDQLKITAEERIKQNEAFSNMSQREKALAVIDDALMQLGAGKTRGYAGAYIRLQDSIKSMLSMTNKTAQECLIDDSIGPCECCVQGSLILSSIRMRNGVSPLALINMGPDDVENVSHDIPRKVMVVCETIYESSDIMGRCSGSYGYELREKCRVERRRLSDLFNITPGVGRFGEWALPIILQNLKDNNGHYVTPDGDVLTQGAYNDDADPRDDLPF